MSNAAKRTDPLWLRAIVSLVVSCVLWLLAFLMLGDLIGPASIYVCAGGAVVSAVLMTWKGQRVGKIATWFFEALSGI